MTADQVLAGIGLTVVLAVGSQVLASRLRIPALIVLLPVGFLAGALTTVVDPDRLLGPAFQPLASLAVAVILYDAGLGVDLSKLRGHPRRVVVRLISLGVPITWALAALGGVPLLGMSRDAAIMLGAILVVSGPTVVGPLLDFVAHRGWSTWGGQCSALASTVLEGTVDGPVFRLAPPQQSHGVVAPYTGGDILFDPTLTRSTVDRRCRDRSQIMTLPDVRPIPAGHDLLFRIRVDGLLDPVTRGNRPTSRHGDVAILLGPVPRP